GDGREIKFNINSKVNGIGYQQQIISVTKDQVLLNMNNDVHKKIRFLINGIETDYVIDHSLGNTLEVSAFDWIKDEAGIYPVIRSMSEIVGGTSISIAEEYLSNVHNGPGLIMGGVSGIAPT